MPSSPRAMMDSRINAAMEAGSLSDVDGTASNSSAGSNSGLVVDSMA